MPQHGALWQAATCALLYSQQQDAVTRAADGPPAQVLVIQFGARASVWCRPGELLPYVAHRADKEAAAAALALAGRFHHADRFQLALQAR